jgi:hypothetical protein
MSKVWLAATLGFLVALAMTLGVIRSAAAQQGRVNPFTLQFDKTGKPTQPFGDQPNLLNNPNATQPWNQFGVGRVDYGQILQYIPVAPQQVSITLYVPVPDGIPPQTQQQTVEIPGYYVAETTTGYYYPERWTLQQMNVGVYQWVKLPAEFRRK